MISTLVVLRATIAVERIGNNGYGKFSQEVGKMEIDSTCKLHSMHTISLAVVWYMRMWLPSYTCTRQSSVTVVWLPSYIHTRHNLD